MWRTPTWGGVHKPEAASIVQAWSGPQPPAPAHEHAHGTVLCKTCSPLQLPPAHGKIYISAFPEVPNVSFNSTSSNRGKTGVNGVSLSEDLPKHRGRDEGWPATGVMPSSTKDRPRSSVTRGLTETHRTLKIPILVGGLYRVEQTDTSVFPGGQHSTPEHEGLCWFLHSLGHVSASLVLQFPPQTNHNQSSCLSNLTVTKYQMPLTMTFFIPTVIYSIT